MVHIRGIDIDVFPGVYPPSEDTFLLMDAVSDEAAELALELCSGTGAVSLSIAERVGTQVCVDIDPKAALNTAHNFRKNGWCADVIVGDLFSPIHGKFDLIMINPPYLPESDWEARDIAWSGGASGREVIDRFLGELGRFLKADGRAYLLQSSLNGIDITLDKAAEAGLEAAVVRTKSFQFESLAVVKLTLPDQD